MGADQKHRTRGLLTSSVQFTGLGARRGARLLAPRPCLRKPGPIFTLFLLDPKGLTCPSPAQRGCREEAEGTARSKRKQAASSSFSTRSGEAEKTKQPKPPPPKPHVPIDETNMEEKKTSALGSTQPFQPRHVHYLGNFHLSHPFAFACVSR